MGGRVLQVPAHVQVKERRLFVQVGGKIASIGEPGRGHWSHLGHASNHQNRNLYLDRFESSRPDLHCEAQAHGWSLASFNRTGQSGGKVGRDDDGVGPLVRTGMPRCRWRLLSKVVCFTCLASLGIDGADAAGAGSPVRPNARSRKSERAFVSLVDSPTREHHNLACTSAMMNCPGASRS